MIKWSLVSRRGILLQPMDRGNLFDACLSVFGGHDGHAESRHCPATLLLAREVPLLVRKAPLLDRRMLPLA